MPAVLHHDAVDRFVCRMLLVSSYSFLDHLFRSSRTMARTGLRMMPTFPSSPLRFRTASFPRYGSKASLSGTTFLDRLAVKPAPDIPAARPSLCGPSPASTTAPVTGSASSLARASADRCSRGSAARALPLCPRGPWLRSKFCCLGPSPLTTTPSASLAGTRRFHGPAAYTPRLRCAGAPRRPTRPSLLSQPSFPHVPSTLRRWFRCPFPLCWNSDTRLPPRNTESPPPHPASASNSRRELVFRRCIVRFMLRPACLPSPPGWLQRSGVICSPLRLLKTLSSPLLTPAVARQRWGSG
jgi:hypothetical protein